MVFNFLDFMGVGEAIWDILFDIFVRGPLYIVSGLGDAITYLSGQKVIDTIFGSTGHFLNMPPQFIVFLAISILMVVLFAGGVILHAMVNHNAGSVIASLANRIIMVLLLLLLIPLFFWIINFIVISIIHIIMPNLTGGDALANMVGSLGFTDGLEHQDWHYDVGYPDWNNYNLFLGTFGSFFCMSVFFLLGLALIKRIFDLFLLYIVSPVVFSTAATGAQWQKVNIWKDLVIGRFISTLGVVLTLTLFMNLEPLMLNVASEVSSTWTGQAAFKLLFIAGGAIATLNAQLLFSSLVGSTVGIADGLSMLTSMKAASLGAKAGTLGMLGVGKGLLWGGKKAAMTKGVAGSTLVSGFASGGIARTASFATKATVGSALAGAGFITGGIASISTFGLKGTAQRVGQQIAKPVTSLGKLIKNKGIAGFNVGNKHETTNLQRALKNQLQTEPINIVKPKKTSSFTQDDKTAVAKSYTYGSNIIKNSNETKHHSQQPNLHLKNDFENLKQNQKQNKTNDSILERWNWENLSKTEEKEAKEWYSKKLQDGQGWVTNDVEQFIPKMKEKWQAIQDNKDENQKENK